MKVEEAKQNLEKAVQRLKLDLAEMGASVSERAIMFRLAYYLAVTCEAGKLRVDCEYNRHGDDPKKLLKKPERAVTNFNDAQECVRFFPDVILHERGTDKNNVLVCEIKKVDDPRDREIDRDRLRVLTSAEGGFEYWIGAFLEVNQARQTAVITYFRHGVQLREPQKRSSGG